MAPARCRISSNAARVRAPQEDEAGGPQRPRRPGRPGHPVPDLLDGLHGVQADPGDLSLTPHLLPAHPTLGNFSAVMSGQASGIGSVWLFFRNSLARHARRPWSWSSVLSLLASIAVARFRFRFRTSFLIMLLVVQMIPAEALVIALFLDFNQLGPAEEPARPHRWCTSRTRCRCRSGCCASSSPRCRGNWRRPRRSTAPSAVRIFWRILLPLVAPGLVATSIFSFITAYNEFIFALTFLGQAHSDTRCRST